MPRHHAVMLRLRPALLTACGAAALAGAEAQAQGDCLDQVEALRLAADNAPGSVTDEAAFSTALNNAAGWYRDGDMANCRGWLDEAETLLSEPEAPESEPEPEPEPDSEPEPQADPGRDAQAAAEAARERAEAAQERAEARAEDARERAEERADAARERAEAQSEAARERREEARERAEALRERRDDAAEDEETRQADRTAAERRARETRREDRGGWLDRWLGEEDEAGAAGAAEAAGEDGFDSRVDPRPVEGAEDRLQVIDPAGEVEPSFDRQRRTAGAFTPSVSIDYRPAIPSLDAMSALERSARRRLVAGPDTTLAEINARGAARRRDYAGFGQAFEPESPERRARDTRSGDAIAVQAVRFDAGGAEIDAAARDAVRQAAAALNDTAMIAVRGDSFDPRFAERADRLVRALAEQGVSRNRIDVLWGRTYGDAPERLELAVMPGGAQGY